MGMLKTIFGADTSKLDKGLDRAQNRVGKFSKNVSRSLGAAFSVAAIGFFFRKMTQDLDRIGKLAARGFSTDFVQDLGQAAELAGSDIEALLPKIVMLFREVNKGGTPSKEFTDNLEAIGLSINDLKGQSPEQLFKSLVAGMQGTSDKATASAAAMVLLRDRGGELNTVLQSLAQGGLPEAARASEDAIRSAEQFNDSMTVMGNTIMTAVAPAITFLNYLLNFVIVGWKKFSAFILGGNMAIAQAFIGMSKAANAALHFDFSGAKKELEDMSDKVKLEMAAIGEASKQADRDMQAFVDDMEKRKTPSILASVSASADDNESPTEKASKITKSTIADSMQRIGGGGRSVVAAQRDESIRIAQSQLEVQRRIATALENQEQEKMR